MNNLLTLVHLEDEKSDRSRLKKLLPGIREQFKTFLKDTFKTGKGKSTTPKVRIELKQVSCIEEFESVLFEPSGKLTTAGSTCILFLLDYYVPRKNYKIDRISEQEAKNHPDYQAKELPAHIIAGLPFFTWLRVMFPAIPKGILTMGEAHVVQIEKEDTYINKESLNNPDEFVRDLGQHFEQWWQPTFWLRLADYGRATAAQSWHTPGHNTGNAFLRSEFQKDFYNAYGALTFQTDLSVSVDFLGDLSEPDQDSPLRDSQIRSASIFGAEETFYITNGTSTSNKALLMTLLQPGEVVLLDRNCHKSVHQAVVMSGALPLYLSPGFNKVLGLWQPVSYPTLVKFLNADYPSEIKPRILILTTCTYEGILYPVYEIANVCEQNEIIFFADEAWAPYLRFHPRYLTSNQVGERRRYSALDGGAHFVVHSTHKALAAFSQASMIHVSSTFKERLEGDGPDWVWLRERFNFGGRGSYAKFRHDLMEMLRYWHSTSPHYPMLSTLDRASIQMRLEGTRLLEERLAWVEGLTQRANNFPGTRNGCIIGLEELVGMHNLGNFPGYLKDPLKIIIGFKDEAAGEKFRKLLEKEKFQWEKLTAGCVEFLVTIGTFFNHIQSLERVIGMGKTMLARPDASTLTDAHFDFEIAKGQVAVSPRRAALCDGEMVELKYSKDRISAQMLVPYPPGIPVFLPGLMITEHMINRVAEVVSKHKVHAVHGLFEEGGKYYVRVMQEREIAEALRVDDKENRHIHLIRELVEGIEQ
jgi:arginine/lysine/ornithine decarboxylase